VVHTLEAGESQEKTFEKGSRIGWTASRQIFLQVGNKETAISIDCRLR